MPSRPPNTPSAHGEPTASPPLDPPDTETTAVKAGRIRNTIIFGIATGLSRVAGLVREMVSASLYGGGAIASAFTLAFTIPNLLRSLFADMALSAAFVPVFTELLEQKRRREAILLLSTLFWVLLIALGILCAVSMATAPLYVPLFTSDDLREQVGNIDHVTTVLSQIMLPTVLLLGLNGLFVGALNAYDHFTVPAISPLVWNVVIVGVNVALLSRVNEEIYAQAIGVLVGTVVQMLMAIPVLRRYGIRLVPRIDLSDPRVKQVLILMFPVAISLGLINFSAAIDAKLAGEVSEQGPRAIEVAFRLYMLPQGVFSVAIVTVLFPVLARAAARADTADLRRLVRGGMAQILVLLVPVGMLFSSPVISHDVVAVLFQRDKWTDSDTNAATTALVFLGASLALNGVSLLLSRTFFALQRPWTNTGLALGSLAANVVASLVLYKPLGIAGIVLGTFVGNVVLVGLQIRLLRRVTGDALGLLPVLRSLISILVASALATAAASGVILIGHIATHALDAGAAQTLLTAIYLAAAIVAALVVYVGLARELELHELSTAGARFTGLLKRPGRLIGRLPMVHRTRMIVRHPFGRQLTSAVTLALEVGTLPLQLAIRPTIRATRAFTGLLPADVNVALAAEAPPAAAGPRPVPAANRRRSPRSADHVEDERHAQARRMIESRDAALERIAERARRREGSPPRRRPR